MGFLLFVLVVVAVIAALLSVPVELHVAGRRGGPLRLDGRWLFGAIRWRSSPEGRTAAPPQPEQPRTAANRRGRRRRGRRAGRKALAAALTPGLPSRAARLVVALLRELRPAELSARARVGLEDPGDTGLLWAGLGPLSGALYALPLDVVLEPDFSEERLELEGSATLRLVPLRLLVLVLGFFLSPAVLRAGIRAVRA